MGTSSQQSQGNQEREVDSRMANKYGVKCPRCQSQQVWKVGFVPTVRGRKDRFKCTNCGHSFYKGQPGSLVSSTPKAAKAKRVSKKKAG